MKDIIKDNRWFLVPFVVLWMVGLVCQLSFGKADIHLFLNSYHTPFLDTFFKYYTEVGGWIPFAVILVLFLFYNVKSGTVLSATEATATLITAGLKQQIGRAHV